MYGQFQHHSRQVIPKYLSGAASAAFFALFTPVALYSCKVKRIFFQGCADRRAKPVRLAQLKKKNLALLYSYTMLKFGRQKSFFPYLDTIEITDSEKNAL